MRMTNEQTPLADEGLVQRQVRHRPLYCPCMEQTPDPCPACGATVSGMDQVHGGCQATGGAPPTDYGLRLIVIDRDTGMLV